MKELTIDQIIQIPQGRPIYSGAYGIYCQVSQNRGIKVLQPFAFESIEKLNAAIKEPDSDFEHFFKLLIQEAALLVLAENTKFAPPQFFKIAAVKIKEKFYLGIVMEHVRYSFIHKMMNIPKEKRLDLLVNRATHEISLFDASLLNSNVWMNLREFVKSEFKKQGIGYTDCHLKNVVYSPEKRIRVMDFSPDRVKIKQWQQYCEICEKIVRHWGQGISLNKEHIILNFFEQEKQKHSEEYYEEKRKWKTISPKNEKNYLKKRNSQVPKDPDVVSESRPVRRRF